MQMKDLLIGRITTDVQTDRTFVRDSYNQVWEIRFIGIPYTPVEISLYETLNEPIDSFERMMRKSV